MWPQIVLRKARDGGHSILCPVKTQKILLLKERIVGVGGRREISRKLTVNSELWEMVEPI